jgi:hypothetical protein
VNQWSGWYFDGPAPQRHVGQTSPNKDMNFQRTTAAFTLSPAPGGLRHLVLTRPGTKPSMRFLSVGSHLCARASSRQTLARLPLPSASSYICPNGHYRYSYRGLSPHQFMPMSGVIGSPGVFLPRLPQHPACGSARGASSGCERTIEVTASNAGYDTARQERFTRSGAVRTMRAERLTRCRRFGPSPYPTHYGGRLATMPSADFCPITPDVTARRAARVAVGSGGDASTFALGLRPAPMATTATLGFDGDSGPFEPALSSTPVAAQAASGADLPG